jgi:YidC/Oxa1 family membrane protein insertase
MPEYQHKPEGGADKQFLLYLFFAFMMVLMFQLLFQKPQPKSSPAEQKQGQQAKNAAPSQPPAVTANAKPSVPPQVATQQASVESEITVESDLYSVTLSNRGAQVKSWVLKKYQDEQGKPLNLVNAQAAPKYGLPLSLFTYDENLRNKINDALFVPSLNCANVQEMKAPQEICNASSKSATITFNYAADGVEVQKKLTFDNSYVAAVETSVRQNGNLVQAFPSWPAALGDQIKPQNYAAGHIDFETPDGVTQTPEHNFIRASKRVNGGETLRQTFYWIGVSSQYFGAFFIPAEPQQAQVVTLNQVLDLPKDASKPLDKDNSVTVNVFGVAAGNANGVTNTKLFVGPKAVDVLKNIHANAADGAAARGPNLEGAISWGAFGFFAKWLFLWMKWTHDHWVAGWGWDILILTLIITVAILPLRLSQMKTSLKMQKVQPLVQNLNKKYEKYSLRDTEKQQQKQAEMMAIYKEHGINPVSMGGCLFMFIQLPLIYAFYEVLESAIELRHANWLWIHDLIAPDPLHILPLLCIVTMIAVQYMTPMPGMDAAQRRMMNIMMVGMFGWFTWAYSAGVAMYLTVSYLISVVQQYFLNRSELGHEIREMQAKRARKAKN